jgi:hypothetical protein
MYACPRYGEPAGNFANGVQKSRGAYKRSGRKDWTLILLCCKAALVLCDGWVGQLYIKDGDALSACYGR